MTDEQIYDRIRFETSIGSTHESNPIEFKEK
jgi:hypothetical protein